MESLCNVIGVAVAVFLGLLALMFMYGHGKSNFAVPYVVQNYISHYVTDQRKAHVEL
jgi:hypothetical protein